MNPEGIVAVPASPLTGMSVVQLISDNGDADFYNDGTAAKNLPVNNFKKFQSDLVALGGLGGANSTLDVGVAIDDGSATATAGAPFSYTITVTNNDTSAALGG